MTQPTYAPERLTPMTLTVLVVSLLVLLTLLSCVAIWAFAAPAKTYGPSVEALIAHHSRPRPTPLVADDPRHALVAAFARLQKP